MVTLDDCAVCVAYGHIQDTPIVQTVDYLPRCQKHGNVPRNQVRVIDNAINLIPENTVLVNEYRRLHGAKPLCSLQDWFHDYDDNGICKWCGYNNKLCMECQEKPPMKSKYSYSLCGDCEKLEEERWNNYESKK